MLVDLPEHFWKMNGRIRQGVYEAQWSFENQVDVHGFFEQGEDRWYPLPLWGYELSFPLMYDFDDDGVIAAQSCWPMYGLCDHWSQLLVKFPQLVSSVIPYLVRVHEVRRQDQPESGGFRFHKWGSYIGAFLDETHYEYLYDSGLESVYTYEVYQMKMGSSE